MNATVTYELSSTGQKARILAGGNGERKQTISVTQDDPGFARVKDTTTSCCGRMIVS